MDSDRRESREPHGVPRLGLWDATSLIVGIIIGVGIFVTPSEVFKEAPQLWPSLGAWLAGGILALVGAFCFAELASTYPHSGGEYVYLSRAFGPAIGFLYAWAQLTLIRPGSIGALAYVFALYAGGLIGEAGPFLLLSLSLGALLVMTAINILGVTLGKNVQNLLTVLKVLGLAGILVIGIGWGNVDRLVATGVPKANWFAGAMIVVLWTYAGWQEAAYVAAEVRDARRNLPLSLILGTVTVIVLYLLVNLAFVLGLGFDGAQSKQSPVDLISLAWPQNGPNLMRVLIVISALGALNGMIFTTARICVAFGADHALFANLAHWSPNWHTPTRALIVQMLVSMALVLGVFALGPKLTPADVANPLEATDPFADLIYVTAAVFWLLFLLTGVSLFVLRQRDAEYPRPFKVPGYPIVPIIFCASCAYMIYGSVTYKPIHSLIGLGITLLGIPLYYLPPRVRRHAIDTRIIGPRLKGPSPNRV
jgi:amino acid transporter